ncbi:autotransporter outer membrane beta-barrel domain-containing protein [Candidatus Bartonella washoeensis]|uniref:Outer membrane autotransporter barrel domain-containing protein n=1 Tax=Cardidatus Bartonella washoeensis 085-0475 TaxID=1094564 RepID=J0QD65_9HYPH|nr:autotransporter outer membrane beta-barrel domain-containing protein [Bartonella washoeensis]EJF83311.1 outer membrane autotransporter barrel domain-containing protein [Bartonella washoeensis 085-0475]
MIKILKSHVCLGALTTSVFFFMQNIDVKAQDQLSCSSLFRSYSCDDLKNLGINDAPYVSGFGAGSVDAIIVKNFNKIVIKSEEGKNSNPDIALKFKSSKILGSNKILHADNFDTSSVKTIVMREPDKAVFDTEEEANSSIGATLTFKNSETIVSGVLAQKKTITVLKNGTFEEGSRSGDGISRAVFGVQQGGFLFVDNGKVDVTGIHGLVSESSPPLFKTDSFGELQDGYMSGVFIQNSDITIKGRESRGLYFRGSSSEEEYEQGELLTLLGEFQFDKSSFKVPDGTAIYSDNVRRTPYITLLEGSRISGDLLLDVKNHSFVAVEAIASSLVGGTRVDSSSYGGIELSDKSKWTVTPRKRSSQGDSQRTDSSLSLVRLVDSSIVFEKPKGGNYQTLYIRDGKSFSDYVYAAAGDARLYVNAYLGSSGDISKAESKADKLVIYGDVYGTTTVYVQELVRRSKKGVKRQLSKAKMGNQNTNRGVSIVQVYGNAKENSFKLSGGYAVMKGSPYRYRLRAYAQRKSIASGNLSKVSGSVADTGNINFWDFRLEREYIKLNSAKLKKRVSRSRKARSVEAGTSHNSIVFDSDSSMLYPESGISAVVPQVPTYLLLPNALFHAGLMDVSNQNKQLETLRAASEDLWKSSKKPAFFVRSYGGSHRYDSDLSALEYGYGGDLGYSTVEAGLLLKAIESAHHTTSFGVMGTYGKLSLQPQDVEQSQKSTFDKWTATAYGSMQHDTGFYVDGLFSYGLLKGDVFTFARGKTATLKSNPLSAALTAGKAFMTGHKGFVFAPQIQVIYQKLLFDKASDIDGFDIEMEKPEQWVMRIGGRLTKTLPASEEGAIVSFNGKLHVTRSFEGKQLVHLGDAFRLGAFGSSLEAGLGFNAQLSSKFSFYGDVTYQQRLSKAGFSGADFSGGLRYRF